MTDKNNVISDIIGNKYNVGKKVARHFEAVFAILTLK